MDEQWLDQPLCRKLEKKLGKLGKSLTKLSTITLRLSDEFFLKITRLSKAFNNFNIIN